MRDIERARFDHAPVLGADLHQLARVRAVVVHGIHGVPAAIEDVVLAAGGLLEADGVAEQADDVRRERADGLEGLDRARRKTNGGLVTQGRRRGAENRDRGAANTRQEP